MALIEIFWKPRHRLVFAGTDPVEAGRCMESRWFIYHQLCINGREYSWPINVMWDITTDREYLYRIGRHIKQCAEIDESFYDINDYNSTT